MPVNNLWIIMPVYNEQDCVRTVVKEWIPVLKKTVPNFTFLALNDGSKDNTLAILKELESEFPELKIIDKPNTGHGQTCIEGYNIALKSGAEWIFQMDSDGQCDPKYIGDLLMKSDTSPVIYGFRKTRDDGFRRYLISRIVTLFSFFATGVWVRDGNVPYRLMNRQSVESIQGKIPSDFHLANILVSVLQQKKYGITWCNIHFRNRIGGTPSVKAYSFAKHGFRLFRQLSASTKLHS